MGKINNKSVPVYNILGGIPKDMPFELIKYIASWNFIIKSPYGFSYYDAPVGWDFKEHNSLRIADHWNFTSKGKTHCQTLGEVHDNTHYTIARYDTITNRYIPIKSYLKSTINVKETIEYKLLWFDIIRLRAIENLTNNVGHNNLSINLVRLELELTEKLLKIIE